VKTMRYSLGMQTDVPTCRAGRGRMPHGLPRSTGKDCGIAA
jgi:hypothetical protein